MTVETRRNGKFAEISVADTGPGVSPEAAKKIFDPFFSTKDHGMGMGLSIVRTIVEAHNGQIEVDNRNGAKGAVFRVSCRWLKLVWGSFGGAGAISLSLGAMRFGYNS